MNRSALSLEHFNCHAKEDANAAQNTPTCYRLPGGRAGEDAEKLALCFAEDAVVYDEGQDHHGRKAIQQWKEEADRKYRYVLEPLDASVDGDMVRVRARLTGDFPGSPVVLDHIFKLADDRIASLEIRS